MLLTITSENKCNVIKKLQCYSVSLCSKRSTAAINFCSKNATKIKLVSFVGKRHEQLRSSKTIKSVSTSIIKASVKS